MTEVKKAEYNVFKALTFDKQNIVCSSKHANIAVSCCFLLKLTCTGYLLFPVITDYSKLENLNSSYYIVR